MGVKQGKKVTSSPTITVRPGKPFVRGTATFNSHETTKRARKASETERERAEKARKDRKTSRQQATAASRKQNKIGAAISSSFQEAYDAQRAARKKKKK